MTLLRAMGLALSATLLFAQAPSPNPDQIDEASVARLRELVQAGAAPRQKLEQAEQMLADQADAAILRRTSYGSDLTEQQAGEMMAAAERRFARRQARVDEGKRLIEAGVMPRVQLTELVESLDRARRERDIAESRARLVKELTEMARAEHAAESPAEELPSGPWTVAERFDGDSVFTMSDWKTVVLAYEEKFGKPVPVSAFGETAVHRSLGFDHRNRVDVALHPDVPEGRWLRRFLLTRKIPYIAFRARIAGKATAPHIHVGPGSTRIARGD